MNSIKTISATKATAISIANATMEDSRLESDHKATSLRLKDFENQLKHHEQKSNDLTNKLNKKRNIQKYFRMSKNRTVDLRNHQQSPVTPQSKTQDGGSNISNTRGG